MRQPPPGTLESVAEEISSSTSSSAPRVHAPHRSSVSTSESECVQRCFATATGAFVVAFSAGLAFQVEFARRLPARLRGFTSVIPAAAGVFTGVETYRFLSARCVMNRRRGAYGSAAAIAARRRNAPSASDDAATNLSGLLARRVRGFSARRQDSSTTNSTGSAAASSASSCINSISPAADERQQHPFIQPQQQQQQQHHHALPQIPVWNHITETPSTPPNTTENAFNLIPGLP